MMPTLKMLSLFAILFCSIYSCHQDSFCGKPVNASEFIHLKGSINTNLVNGLMELSVKSARILPQGSKAQFESIFASQDTLVLSIANLCDESEGMKLSCMLSKTEFVQKADVVYVIYKWERGERAIKYAREN